MTTCRPTSVTVNSKRDGLDGFISSKVRRLSASLLLSAYQNVFSIDLVQVRTRLIREINPSLLARLKTEHLVADLEAPVGRALASREYTRLHIDLA